RGPRRTRRRAALRSRPDAQHSLRAATLLSRSRERWPMSTPTALRYVDPRASRGPIYRAYVGLASSRLATWLSTKSIWSAIVWKTGPYLFALTRGRLGTGLLLPPALLQTRGARTGLVRRNAVIYFHDRQRVTIIASQAGRPDNPSWYYNARANPD